MNEIRAAGVRFLSFGHPVRCARYFSLPWSARSSRGAFQPETPNAATNGEKVSRRESASTLSPKRKLESISCAPAKSRTGQGF